jgi:zinc D-Ala-D-Ala dipeptidase
MRTRTGAAALLAFMAAAISAGAAAAQQRELPAGFVDAASVVPGLIVDMRYTTTDNFTGRPVDGYEAPVCILTERAATALLEVQNELRPFGLGLKVFDCYRPARAVAQFVRWAADPADTLRKAEFYPELDKSRLFELGYIAERSGHSRGSTVDLTLVELTHGNELFMGTGWDLFSRLSWPMDGRIEPEHRALRMLLRSLMMKHGFRPYDQEWWHFTLNGEPFPDTYFDFPVRDYGR